MQLDYWTTDQAGPGSGSSNFTVSGIPGSSEKPGMPSGKRGSEVREPKRESGKSGSETGKASIKTSVWFMQVLRLGSGLEINQAATFTMHYWLKEKKQKSEY